MNRAAMGLEVDDSQLGIRGRFEVTDGVGGKLRLALAVGCDTRTMRMRRHEVLRA